jgi:hypothetical protein
MHQRGQVNVSREDVGFQCFGAALGGFPCFGVGLGGLLEFGAALGGFLEFLE